MASRLTGWRSRRRPALWLTLAVLVVAIGAWVRLERSHPAAAEVAPAAQWLEAAYTLLARGRWEAALRQLQAAHQADPAALEAGLVLAATHLALQRPEQAIQVLTRLPAPEQASGRALVHTLLGLAYQASGRPALAAAAFGRALEADGTALLALVGLGQLAREAAHSSGQPLAPAWPDPPPPSRPEGWLELSEGYLRRATELNPEAVEPWLELARSQLAGRRWSEALTTLQRVQRLDPFRAEAHFLLGVAHEGEGRLQEAAAAYRRALELEPDHAEARRRLRRLTPADLPG